MTIYLLSSTTWKTLSQMSQNTYALPGIFYPTDANLSVGTGEMTIFCSSVPLTQVTPLLTTRGVVIGPKAVLASTIAHNDVSGATTAEGGLTNYLAAPGETQPVFAVFTDQDPVGGIMIHEWGHCTDSQFSNGPQALALTSYDATITALWTRTTQLPSYDGTGHTYYGWVNIREYWAELYRNHWGGVEYGSGLLTSSADQLFRNLISGTGATAPDDSFTVEMHNYIEALVPPYGPRLSS